MRKLFRTTINLVILCAAFTSCSKSTDVYDPDIHGKEAKSAYVQHFESLIGGSVNSSVDWGFGRATKSGTRSDLGWTIGNDEPNKYYDSYIKEILDTLVEGEEVQETATVKRNFEFKSDEGVEFCFIFSNTTENLEIGYYYYNPEEGVGSHKDVAVVNNWVDDLKENQYFYIVSTTGSTFYPESDWGDRLWENGVGDYIEAKHVAVGLDDMPAGSIFGYYFKIGDQKIYTNAYLNPDNRSFFSLIDIPRDDTKSHLTQAHIIGMEDTTDSSTDFDCNDVIISMEKKETLVTVIPEKPEDPEPDPEPLVWYRIIGEDLIVHDSNWDIDESEADFDFNDIVLDVAFTKDESGQDILKCILQASGGTLPIRIDGNDDLEVHKLFGVDTKVMVNTNAKAKNLNGDTKDPVEFEIRKSFSSVKDVKIQVYKNQNSGWVEMQAPVGEAPAKMCVDTDLQWPEERVSLKTVYPNFPSYAKNNVPIEWWKKL